MKSFFQSIVCSLILFSELAPQVWAETSPVITDEEMVRQLDNKERQAVLSGDIATLEKVWAPDFMVNNVRNFVTPNRDAVLGFVKNLYATTALFERKIESIRLFGDTAIVMGWEVVEEAAKPKTATVRQCRRFTNIWQKTDPSWVMIARHFNQIECMPPVPKVAGREVK